MRMVASPKFELMSFQEYLAAVKASIPRSRRDRGEALSIISHKVLVSQIS